MLLTLSPPHVTHIPKYRKKAIRPAFIKRYSREFGLVWLINAGGAAFPERTKRLYMLGGPTSWEANLNLIIYASVFHIELCSYINKSLWCVLLARSYTLWLLPRVINKTFVHHLLVLVVEFHARFLVRPRAGRPSDGVVHSRRWPSNHNRWLPPGNSHEVVYISHLFWTWAFILKFDSLL